MSGGGHYRGSPRSIIQPVMPPYGTEDPKNSEDISLGNFLRLLSLVGHISCTCDCGSQFAHAYLVVFTPVLVLCQLNTSVYTTYASHCSVW